MVFRGNRPQRLELGLLIVTVTLNAALDRTLTVPNFQRGQRHRASAGLTLAGGTGINIARALKLLDVPVVATGLAGGRTGERIIEDLTGEAILNDFVRIEAESRTSTAVVDPTASAYTEVYEWGPQVEPEELELLREKIHYLARGADTVVFAGSLPRGVSEDFYAEAIRDLNKRKVETVLDSEGEPLRLGAGAEPMLVSPNQREAEALAGQEFHDDQDFTQALDDIHELGARNVLITQESGCFALLRENGSSSSYVRLRPESRPPRPSARGTCCSPVSSPLASSASLWTRRCGARSAREPPRRSRSAPAVSIHGRRVAWRTRSRFPNWSRSRPSRWYDRLPLERRRHKRFFRPRRRTEPGFFTSGGVPKWI